MAELPRPVKYRHLKTASDPVGEPVKSFRPEIQGLRAIAVALVILNHAQVPGLEGGYIGVDVFFVISGYVITGLLVRRPAKQVWTNLGHFYARRIRRIVPAACVVLAFTVLAAYWLLGANFDATVLSDARWASLFSANFRFINTGSNYLIPNVPPSLVQHYWSLAVEEQFYIFFPVVVFALTWIVVKKYQPVVLGSFLVLSIVVSSWWSFHITTPNNASAYFSPFTRFWELALGGFVAVLPVAWAKRTAVVNPSLAVLAFLVLGVCAFRLNTFSNYPGLLAWWPCGATAVILWVGHSASTSVTMRWLSTRPMRYVGDISYSLYLYHFAWLMIPLQMVTPQGSWWARILEVTGTFVCAAISFHFLENPIRHSRLLDRDPVAVILVLLIFVALVWNATWLVARWAPA